MSITTAVGYSRRVDSQDAGAQAAQLALSELKKPPAAFGLLTITYAHNVQQVLTGAAAVLADTPLLGFSTSEELIGGGQSRHSVALALLSGDQIHARAGWWPEFTVDSLNAVGDLFRSLRPNPDEQEDLLVVTDGLGGDMAHLCQVLSAGRYGLAAWLAGGELPGGRTYQVGGRRAGNGGLAGAVLGGDVSVGVGAAHGWQPVGARVEISDVDGLWIRALDGKPPNEVYAQLFGYTAFEWTLPPLNELVRIYPLGFVDSGFDDGLMLRSPLRVETDGSLRMNAPLVKGQTAELMVGSRQACLAAARRAARQAMAELGSSRPRLALVVADTAWQMMLETQPGAEVAALKDELGEDVPVIGGYSFGQFYRSPKDGRVRFLNQHILVALFGEKSSSGDVVA